MEAVKVWKVAGVASDREGGRAVGRSGGQAVRRYRGVDEVAGLLMLISSNLLRLWRLSCVGYPSVWGRGQTICCRRGPAALVLTGVQALLGWSLYTCRQTTDSGKACTCPREKEV